jgi:2',3'-cyclic-nucleotide 2'-phosphodiesterase (5'-nucleotidase family)
MKQKAGPDEIVLAIDSGDILEGTGLSDATSPEGSFIVDIFKTLPIDVMTLGNHDLYEDDTIDYIADNLYTALQGKLISGNGREFVNNYFFISLVAYKNSSKTLADKYAIKEIPGFGKILILGFMEIINLYIIIFIFLTWSVLYINFLLVHMQKLQH